MGTALSDQPVIFPELGVHVHVNNVPATSEVKRIPVGRLLQICLAAGVLERSGTGKTVITKSTVMPVQPEAEGVIW